MAFDGIVIANLVKECNETIVGGKISKIAQPEQDELLITIKNQKNQYRLFLSANASLPLVYFTSSNRPSPLTAPNFCMLLRKHIGNGKITRIWQPGLERIINFEIEHLNELGDLCRKVLIAEIMGKHSNLIFCDDSGKIIDSIKHVPMQMSSVREVLPGRTYFIPQTQHKQNPLDVCEEDFCLAVFSKPEKLSKAIYSSFTGISPVIAEELCFRASLESDQSACTLSQLERRHLFHQFELFTEEIKSGDFKPNIVFSGKEPVEFSSVPMKQYRDLKTVFYPSVSEVLETYYAVRNTITRIRQKSSDLRRIVQTALERNVKKYDLQCRQLKDTEYVYLFTASTASS